jgi:hypothetical protein
MEPRVVTLQARQPDRCFVEVAALPLEEIEVHQSYIAILDRDQELKVVTAIEVVSPSNKRPGLGRSAYLAKQRATLMSDCNLVEIDLLRDGRHVLAVPEAEARNRASYHYLVTIRKPILTALAADGYTGPPRPLRRAMDGEKTTQGAQA